MIIGVDGDGVLLDLVGASVPLGEKLSGRRVSADEVTQWCVASSWGVDKTTFYAQWNEPGFCARIPAYEGALGFVEELRKRGRVVAVTSPFKTSRHWRDERAHALMRDFGFAGDDIVLASDKTLINVDVLIDDAEHNVKDFVSTGRPAVLIDRPWNRGCETGLMLRRAKSYAEAVALVRLCE